MKESVHTNTMHGHEVSNYPDGTPLEQPVYVEDKMQRLDININGKAKVIRFNDQSYEGRVFGELHIAEVAINRPIQHPSVD